MTLDAAVREARKTKRLKIKRATWAHNRKKEDWCLLVSESGVFSDWSPYPEHATISTGDENAEDWIIVE